MGVLARNDVFLRAVAQDAVALSAFLDARDFSVAALPRNRILLIGFSPLVLEVDPRRISWERAGAMVAKPAPRKDCQVFEILPHDVPRGSAS
jgi:hypothetical protein